jgi:hypothetical protein
VTVAFSPTGAEQSWTVPDGVSTIHVVLVGGRGQKAFGEFGVNLGWRARVEGDLSVTPGQSLFVESGTPPSRRVSTVARMADLQAAPHPAAVAVGASDIRTLSSGQPGTLDLRPSSPPVVVAAGAAAPTAEPVVMRATRGECPRRPRRRGWHSYRWRGWRSAGTGGFAWGAWHGRRRWWRRLGI